MTYLTAAKRAHTHFFGVCASTRMLRLACEVEITKGSTRLKGHQFCVGAQLSARIHWPEVPLLRLKSASTCSESVSDRIARPVPAPLTAFVSQLDEGRALAHIKS
jgi:hypothetical protein